MPAPSRISGTWRAGSTVELTTQTIVAAGDTLTIEAGVRVVARPGAGLFVARGAVVHAVGSMYKPIVFTCADNMGVAVAGCWQGVVLQGYAPINSGSLTSPAPSGGGASGCRERVSEVTNSRYGGCDVEDGSGRLEWVRLEYAVDGLRLEGVGRRTRVEQVEVIRSRRDGFVIDGGTRPATFNRPRVISAAPHKFPA